MYNASEEREGQVTLTLCKWRSVVNSFCFWSIILILTPRHIQPLHSLKEFVHTQRALKKKTQKLSNSRFTSELTSFLIKFCFIVPPNFPGSDCSIHSCHWTSSQMLLRFLLCTCSKEGACEGMQSKAFTTGDWGHHLYYPPCSCQNTGLAADSSLPAPSSLTKYHGRVIVEVQGRHSFHFLCFISLFLGEF